MNHHYKDIRDRLGEPQWWDECGVPRYCEFSPRATNNIYAREAVLLLIACQNCGRRFPVALTSDVLSEHLLADLVRDGEIHYGDPPNVHCCPAGPTMNSVPLRVVEFWRWGATSHDWERVPELERPIACAWAEDVPEGRL